MRRTRTTQEAAAARGLQDLGIPLEFDEDQCRFVFIRQHGSHPSNSAFELSWGGTGFIFDVSITSDLPNLCISYMDLTVPWPDPNFSWLDDPAETRGRAGNYRFPGTDLLFERNLVINHSINNLRHPLRRGSSIQGLLLGFGGRIPAEFKHGMEVPARLTVVDQFDCVHPQELDLWIDRSESLLRRKSPRQKREPIFGAHDKVHKLLHTTSTESGGTRPLTHAS